MIKQIFNSFSRAFIFAIIIYMFEYLVESNFINSFFSTNLVGLLTTLLAINVATLGIVLTRIIELSQSDSSFSNTKTQILLSLKEQVGLIFISLILSILSESEKIPVCPGLLDHVVNVLFLTIFIYAICILYDTAKALVDIH